MWQFNMLMSNHISFHTNSNTLHKSAISTPSPRVYSNITKTCITAAVVGNLFIKLNCPFEEELARFACTNAVVKARDDVATDWTRYKTLLKLVTCEF